ncbi:MAG TPA: hypothetical protein PLG75_05690 [Methanoculleus sp.]|nr:hypothetical protein [Methanoculleus sp.]
MKKDTVLILTLLAVAVLLPGAAAGETSIECSFNESHAEVYEQMLAENATLGEYYERVCPEFLESMPPETRAHLYSTTMRGYRDLASDRVVFVPPGKQVAIGIASPVLGVCGVPVPLYSAGFLALFGVVILALLAAVALVLKRVRKKKE